jgi:class 3 adenylate cyclase
MYECVGWSHTMRALSIDGVEVVAVPRQVQTLLFTDIVASTDRLRDLGDAAWTALLVRYYGVIRAVIGAHGGREVNTAGDGFLARFDAPAPAVRAAAAAVAAVEPLGIRIRVGLHAGEVEFDRDQIAGVAVHLAARVMAQAGAGQVLVSATVRELLAGSELGFVDLGMRKLKGFAQRWRLFAVDPATVQGDSGAGAKRVASEPMAQAQGPGEPTVPFPEPLAVSHRPQLPTPLPAVWNVPFLRNPAFTGRDDELRRLLAVYDAAAAGHGRVVTILGEAGIGKTRLLQELAASVRRRGALALSGRCLEGAWVPPYQAFVEATTGYAAEASPARLRADLGPAAGPLARLVPGLRELLPDLPTVEPLQPEEERLRLLDAVARFLAGLTAYGPVVLALDDLHWADPSTLVTLRHLARVLAPHRLLLVVAYRSDEAGPDLLGTLGALRAEAEVTTLHLHGLATDALGRMLGELAAAPVSAALAETIQQETRGNPFFAREVILHLLETQVMQRGADGTLQADLPLEAVPEGLRDVLARRRSRLSPDANRLLDAAAAFDGPFPYAVVAEVAALDDDAALAALDQVLDAGLIDPDVIPERYQFGHALIRHAVYADLNPSRRVRLHRRMAQALEAARATSPTRVTPAEVAAQYHRSAALPGAEAGVTPALEAAEQAQAASAHGEAASFLAMACELAPPGDARLLRLRARLGLALAWSSRFDEAVRVAREAADEIAAVEGREAAAGYLAEVTSALTNADSAGHAWQLAAKGLAYAGGHHDAVWASLMLLDLDRRDAADPKYPGIVLDVPERHEALRILHRAGALTDRVDLLRYAVAAIYGSRERIPPEAGENSTVRLFVLGDYAGALPRFAAEVAEAHARGQLAREVYCLGCVARCRVVLGQLEAGRAALAEAHAVADRIAAGSWGWQRVHAIVGAEHALALATDEGWEDWLRLVAEVSGARSDAWRWAQSSFDAGAAVAQARLGRPDRALQLVAAVLPALQRASAWALNYLRTACDAAETLWLLGRRDHLQVIETALRDKALAADFRWPMADARLSLARLCALDGRDGEAKHWFAEARSTLDAQGARPLRAIVDFDEALMHERAGRRNAAQPLLDAALGQFARLQMPGWLRRARPANSGP